MGRRPVEIEGLAALRRDLRAIDRQALKEVQAVTKSGAAIVAAEASRLAPKRSGRLALSIKASTSGNSGIVRSRLPYAKVQEYGGTIRPRGTPIKIAPSRYVDRAIDRKQDDVEDALVRGFDALARRNGWT